MRCLRQLRLQLPVRTTGKHSVGNPTVDPDGAAQQEMWHLKESPLTCGVSRFDLSLQLHRDARHLFVGGVASATPLGFLRGVTFEVDKCHQTVAAGLSTSCRRHRTWLLIKGFTGWFFSLSIYSTGFLRSFHFSVCGICVLDTPGPSVRPLSSVLPLNFGCRWHLAFLILKEAVCFTGGARVSTDKHSTVGGSTSPAHQSSEREL